MKYLLLASAAIVTFASSTAMAQETYYKDGDHDQVVRSASPYIGAYGGYGWMDDSGVDLDGAQYGLYAGMQADSLLDATINRTGLALSGAIEGHYGWANGRGDGFERENEWGVSFRPGMSFISNTLALETVPYAILGYKRAEIENAAGDDNWHDGFELGIGTELVAWDHMSTRLEYSHTFYEERGGIDPDDDSVRLGLGYRF